jgi:hypothetical protein
MLVGPVHQWEVWARSSQRQLASSNLHTSTTRRQKRTFVIRVALPVGWRLPVFTR